MGVVNLFSITEACIPHSYQTVLMLLHYVGQCMTMGKACIFLCKSETYMGTYHQPQSRAHNLLRTNNMQLERVNKGKNLGTRTLNYSIQTLSWKKKNKKQKKHTLSRAGNYCTFEFQVFEVDSWFIENVLLAQSWKESSYFIFCFSLSLIFFFFWQDTVKSH